MEQISAHWKDMLRGFDGNPQNLRGVSSLHSPFLNPLHRLFQADYRALGSELKSFETYMRAGQAIASRQRRAFDLNMLRQSLTLAFCDQHGALADGAQYVIVGDGYAALGSLILESVPGSKICFINIAPVLEIDRQFFKAAHPTSDAIFVAAEDMDQMPPCHVSSTSPAGTKSIQTSGTVTVRSDLNASP